MGDGDFVLLPFVLFAFLPFDFFHFCLLSFFPSILVSSAPSFLLAFLPFCPSALSPFCLFSFLPPLTPFLTTPTPSLFQRILDCATQHRILPHAISATAYKAYLGNTASRHSEGRKVPGKEEGGEEGRRTFDLISVFVASLDKTPFLFLKAAFAAQPAEDHR